jgi:hypothetical protein
MYQPEQRKKMKVVVATEIWNTKFGKVSKAVVRTVDGKFLGATNQTANKTVTDLIVVGRK